jgi:hypothetical protein
MFAWYQLDFSAIPVSISAVSLTSRQTWQNVNNRRKWQIIQNVQEGKRHQKKETSSCFCFCSFCFGGEVSNSWILNDIGTLYQERAVFGKMKMDPAKRAQTQNAGEVSSFQWFFSQSVEMMADKIWLHCIRPMLLR